MCFISDLVGPDKTTDALDKAVAGKRKSGAIDDEIMAFTNMTDVARAIRYKKLADMHHDLYKGVINIVAFTGESLMAVSATS
jgi:hypothetical protein